MAEVDRTYLYVSSDNVGSMVILPIPWVLADGLPPKVKALDAELYYYSNAFDSAEWGALLAALPVGQQSS